MLAYVAQFERLECAYLLNKILCIVFLRLTQIISKEAKTRPGKMHILTKIKKRNQLKIRMRKIIFQCAVPGIFAYPHMGPPTWLTSSLQIRHCFAAQGQETTPLHSEFVRHTSNISSASVVIMSLYSKQKPPSKRSKPSTSEKLRCVENFVNWILGVTFGF